MHRTGDPQGLSRYVSAGSVVGVTVGSMGDIADVTTLDPAALSYLISQHGPREPGPCRVCGSELAIGSMGGGKATVYHCSSPEASSIEAGRIDREQTGNSWGPGTKSALEHWQASEVSVAYHGDWRVCAALQEYRALRESLGEDMTVPVGALLFPYGHGRDRCWNVLVHRGNDVWEQQPDFEYTHDPSHRTAEPGDDTSDTDA